MIISTYLEVDLSILLFLGFDLGEFFIILVSWPVYVTTPYTNSVFFKDDPRSRKLSYPRETAAPSIDVFPSKT